MRHSIQGSVQAHTHRMEGDNRDQYWEPTTSFLMIRNDPLLGKVNFATSSKTQTDDGSEGTRMSQDVLIIHEAGLPVCMVSICGYSSHLGKGKISP